MTPNHEEAIFSTALAIQDAVERNRYVAEACGTDALLREHILALLDAERAGSDFFKPVDSAADQREDAEPDREGVGDRVGRYRILEKIGEGGFGVVYMAEQEEPIRRRVALKIVKPGMDTRQVLARFEAERQALAMMEHPHIAKIFDAGTTGHRRPYFVMELVRGLPITEFCDEGQLTCEERLNLILEVCEAVQHAHQKGVIHRDLKPSNILVSLEGSRAVPKVIDFGVAKAVYEPLTDKTVVTRFHQFIGTPAYMSPEQVEMSNLGIDTRSDIYSLGVLLYELLIGQTPLESGRFTEAGMLEVRRIILEDEPSKPSTRLSALNESELTTTASRRRCPPERLVWALKGDLDRIVMKAIDKDREQRYESAGALSQDIQRFLRQEPVLAGPPSARYRFGKFVRRNRVVVVAGSLATLGLVAGLIMALFGLFKANRAMVRAEDEARKANEQTKTAELVLEFLNWELIGQVDPFRSSTDRPANRNLKLLTAIRLAIPEIEKRFRDRPLVEAEVRLTIARAFRGLGELGSAEAQIQRVLEIHQAQPDSEPAKLLAAMQEKAWLLIDQSKHDEAAELSQEILGSCRRDYGLDHDRTLEAMNSVATAFHRGSKDLEALKLFQEVVRRAQTSQGRRTAILLTALNGLAGVYFELGDFEKRNQYKTDISKLAHEELGPDHPVTLRVAVDLINPNNLAKNSQQEPDQLAEDVLQRCQRVLGEEHPTTIAVLSKMNGLAIARGLTHLGGVSNLVEISRRALGEDDPKAILEEMRYGSYLKSLGYLDQAERCLADAMERLHEIEGPDTLNGRRVLRWLSDVYLAQGRYSDAERMRGRALEACRRLMGMESPWTQAQFWALANIYGRQGKWQSCAQVYQELLFYAPADYGFAADFPSGAACRAHAAGLVASGLARDQDGIHQIRRLALDRFTDAEDPDIAYEVSLALLLAPEVEGESGRAFSLAARAVEGLRDPLKQTLLAGILAYRQKRWSDAIEHLSPLASDAMKNTALGDEVSQRAPSGPDATGMTTSSRGQTVVSTGRGNPDAPVACLAGFILAMAYQEADRAEAAEQALLTAIDRLGGMVRSGDLGKTTQYPDDAWLPLGAAILAGREAEELIRGQGDSTGIDDAYLILARRKWESVKEAIAQANWSARHREWEQAKEEFLHAAQCGDFDWDAAAHDGDELATKLAALFVLTGESDLYTNLSERLLKHALVSQTQYATPALLSPGLVSEESESRTLAMARWREQENERMKKAEPDRLGDLLTLGLAEYRSRDATNALAHLRRVQKAYDLRRSGTAFALSSLAEWDLAREDDARQNLARAEEIFQEVVEGSQEDLGRWWANTAIFEIALREARQVIGANR